CSPLYFKKKKISFSGLAHFLCFELISNLSKLVVNFRNCNYNRSQKYFPAECKSEENILERLSVYSDARYNYTTKNFMRYSQKNI
ncbi:hypothetical protein Avbf_16024, partial [Armadillidium vulgare]